MSPKALKLKIILTLVIIAAITVAAVSFRYFLKKWIVPATPSTPQKELTREEILELLSAPSDAPQRTSEEKKAILESLSSPGESVYTGEGKRQILDSLSAPSGQSNQ